MPIQPLDTLLALKAIHLAPGLNANARRVAAALLEHFNRRTGQCDPSLERLAELLGISTRTVIRSNHSLERAGLFKKTRHGGHSNRNSYEPMWSRFREIEAAWSARFNRRANSSVSEVSPARRQACHLEGDNRVTQTVEATC
jgi:DNA-binding IclR family transcriptional regulator